MGNGFVLGLIAVCALVAVLAYGGTQDWFGDLGFININVNQQSPGGVVPPASVPTVDSRVDLCSLATPYLLDLSACDSAGGVFTCTFDEVSCIGSTVALDCGGAVAVSAQIQCGAVGGTWFCDSANVGCRY